MQGLRSTWRLLAFAGLVGLYIFLTTLGATDIYLQPAARMQMLAVLTVVMLVWLIWHWRARWTLPRTALNGPILIWGLAIFVSLLMNQLTWRREMLGVWFAGLFVILWYLVSDVVANGGLTRVQLVAVIPLGGIVPIVRGFQDAQPWLSERLPLVLSGAAPFELPRPGSLYGNPNILAAVLVVLVPLSLAAARRQRGVLRWLYVLIAVAAVVLMLLSFSRGGWMGLTAALLLQLALTLRDRDMLNLGRLRQWWNVQTGASRVGTAVAVGVGVLAILLVVVVLVMSLSIGGRTLGLRTWIYQAAINVFAEHPLAGSGLFTFGRGLSQHASQPPFQVHNHAHNLILNVAAELGLLGLTALGVTLWAVWRAARANWRVASSHDRMLLSGGLAAVFGFLVHHMVDFPVIFPIVAVTALVPLVVVVTPMAAPAPAMKRPRRLVVAGALGVGCIVLLATGFWSTVQYQAYVDLLHSISGNYRESAEAFQTLIDDDPALAVNYYEQGYLYGLAAWQGDEAALPQAIDSFERYVVLEPYYAMGWANLGALYAQAGAYSEAAQAMRQAVAVAPEFWHYQYLLGQYEEQAGNIEAARVSYQHLLGIAPDVVLLPDWRDSLLRDTMSGFAELSEVAQLALLLEDGQIRAAGVLWADPAADLTGGEVLGFWLSLSERNVATAQARYEDIPLNRTSRESVAWRYLAEALLSRARGDMAASARAVGRARETLTLGLFEGEANTLANIHYFQFLRTTIARQFLPQVDFPMAGPVLQRVLHTVEARTPSS